MNRLLPFSVNIFKPIRPTSKVRHCIKIGVACPSPCATNNFCWLKINPSRISKVGRICSIQIVAEVVNLISRFPLKRSTLSASACFAENEVRVTAVAGGSGKIAFRAKKFHMPLAGKSLAIVAASYPDNPVESPDSIWKQAHVAFAGIRIPSGSKIVPF